MSNRVVTPDTRAQFSAFGFRRARLADVREIEHTLVSVQPTVWTPKKTVHALVRVLVPKSIQQNLRRTVRNVVVILVGNKKQLRRGAAPPPAVANFESAHQIQSFGKNRARLEF